MNNFLFEFIGTAFLILLGYGVVANVVLNKTKGNNGGWIVIIFGWAIAVFVGVYISAAQSGAHLNPAVSIALAAAGKFDWANVPMYIAGQFAGIRQSGQVCGPDIRPTRRIQRRSFPYSRARRNPAQRPGWPTTVARKVPAGPVGRTP